MRFPDPYALARAIVHQGLVDAFSSRAMQLFPDLAPDAREYLLMVLDELDTLITFPPPDDEYIEIADWRLERGL